MSLQDIHTQAAFHVKASTAMPQSCLVGESCLVGALSCVTSWALSQTRGASPGLSEEPIALSPAETWKGRGWELSVHTSWGWPPLTWSFTAPLTEPEIASLPPTLREARF